MYLMNDWLFYNTSVHVWLSQRSMHLQSDAHWHWIKVLLS